MSSATVPKGLAHLLQQLPQTGRLEWIGIRPARGELMQRCAESTITVGGGLAGDRFKGRADRQSTCRSSPRCCTGKLSGRSCCDVIW